MQIFARLWAQKNLHKISFVSFFLKIINYNFTSKKGDISNLPLLNIWVFNIWTWNHKETMHIDQWKKNKILYWTALHFGKCFCAFNLGNMWDLVPRLHLCAHDNNDF